MASKEQTLPLVNTPRRLGATRKASNVLYLPSGTFPSRLEHLLTSSATEKLKVECLVFPAYEVRLVEPHGSWLLELTPQYRLRESWLVDRF